jgi:hypothetical protein
MDRFRDKFNLACLGILGPEFLFMLALGQLNSARRSVEVSPLSLSSFAGDHTNCCTAIGIPC